MGLFGVFLVVAMISARVWIGSGMGETKHDARRLKKFDLNPVIKIPIRGV